MLVDGVCAKANELDTALCELGLQLGKSAQLGGADGGKVLWMAEEDNPLVANVVVEGDLGRAIMSGPATVNAAVDWIATRPMQCDTTHLAIRGLCGEVGGCRAESEGVSAGRHGCDGWSVVRFWLRAKMRSIPLSNDKN